MGIKKLSDNYISMKQLVKEVSEVVQKISGNVLGDKQYHMVETRLSRRFIELGIEDPTEYHNYLNENYKVESSHLVSLLTTHHTFFFREYIQFEYLGVALPHIIKKMKEQGRTKLKVWSAACSRGQEVYTLAMFLKNQIPKHDDNIDFEILGSDIDPQSVEIAQNGVYHKEEIKEVPLHYLSGNWSKGTGEIAHFVRAKDSLRTHCKFNTLNLMNFKNSLEGEVFDIIFCRNVFIYFTEPQIKEVVNGFLAHLQPHGLIFSGVSESLNNLKLPIRLVGKSIYSHLDFDINKKDIKESDYDHSDIKIHHQDEKDVPVIELKNHFRVLIVDDSTVIQKILQKIFTKDKGFEVVGVAKNGVEAHELAQKTEFDVMTLDIHMPEMDGIEYLRNYFNDQHPPVMIVSSASRDDASTALKALSLGASDFVEKPALDNFDDRAGEILNKAMVLGIEGSHLMKDMKTEKIIMEPYEIKNPQIKLRVIFGGLSDREKIKAFFSDIEIPQPPTVIMFEGMGELIQELGKDVLKEVRGYDIEYVESGNFIPQINKIYFCDPVICMKDLKDNFKSRQTSMVIYGAINSNRVEYTTEWSELGVLVEELPGNSIRSIRREGVLVNMVPSTSLSYDSVKYLSNK